MEANSPTDFPVRKTSYIHWLGGKMSSGAGQGNVAKDKILTSVGSWASYHPTKIGDNSQQNHNKELYCNFCLLCDKGCPQWGCHKPNHIFIAALRRFIARRGKPKTIHSDNGTNFQGASNQLHEIYKMLQSSSQMARVQDFLANEGSDWKFIPPHGPHFGGLWEAAMKSMKHHWVLTLPLTKNFVHYSLR